MPKNYATYRELLAAADDELNHLYVRLTALQTQLHLCYTHAEINPIQKEVREIEARIGQLLSNKSEWYQEISKMFKAPVM